MVVGSTEQFQLAWRTILGDRPPLIHKLLQPGPYAWLRLHTFPDSRRAPRDEKEKREAIGFLQNILQLVGKHWEQVTVSFGVFGNRFPEASPEVIRVMQQAKEWWQIRVNDDEPDEVPIMSRHLLGELPLQSSAFLALLGDIADGHFVDLYMVTSPDSPILHCYDGGIDLFAKDSKSLEIFAQKFKGHLSTRDDGR